MSWCVARLKSLSLSTLFCLWLQRRDIQPSLFFGTRGAIASTVAYLLGGPADSDRHLRFREFMKMPSDGAIIAVEWELPFEDNPATNDERKQEILRGKIRQPVVLILHGMNNHADFGYVRSLMRMCAKRGWVAAGMNLRGSGGVNLATPRGYNAAYTGDVRSVVNFIEGRLDESGSIFLVGNSLGKFFEQIMTSSLGPISYLNFFRCLSKVQI